VRVSREDVGTIDVSLTKWTSDKPVFSKQRGRGSHHEGGGKQRGRGGDTTRVEASREGGDKPRPYNATKCFARLVHGRPICINRRKAHYKLEG
jgi:hypothetical protein